jgi:drug/metabolite transporter (DMT)-like permease
LGGNNTYWPRDIRQLAILLAFAGVILICRARLRGVVAGAIATIGWLGADLWLDRVDVAGRSAATWLAVGGVAVFAAAAVVAARFRGTSRKPSGPASRAESVEQLLYRPVGVAVEVLVDAPPGL